MNCVLLCLNQLSSDNSNFVLFMFYEHVQLQDHKNFVDTEIVEVQQEASELNPGWEKVIWPQANNFHMVNVPLFLICLLSLQ